MGLCKFYLEQGHHVIGISRRVNTGLDSYQNFTHFEMDLKKTKSVISVVNRICKTINQINLLVLNAGVLGEIQRMESTSLRKAKEIMDINLWANKVLIDRFLLNGIHITQVVGISSGAAKNGSAGWGPYSICKAALNMLIQTYAAENPNTHFSAIAPGLVDTAMQEYICSLDSKDEFPSISKLQSAKGTPDMPRPILLAPKLDQVFKEAIQKESGLFTDIRM